MNLTLLIMPRNRIRRVSLYSLLLLFLVPLTSALHAQQRRATIDIIHYEVDLDLDFDTKEIAGDEKITAICLDEGMGSCTLDAKEIAVDHLTVDAVPSRSRIDEQGLVISLPHTMRHGDTFIIALRYRARPTSGLKFDIDQVYTAFHTERWLVSNADPADKATLSLALTLPDTLSVAASGHLVARTPAAPGRARHAWRSEIPYSSYLFGFAAGPFNDTTITEGGRRYRFLGTMRSDTLARIFAVTPEIFSYFRERAGIDLPDSLYTQVLLHGDIEQEVSNLTLLRASYAEEILTDPREDWLLAHEAAHQWWGNMITCASWSEIWLNEGFATFMTACYKESKWGRDEYDREMSLARARYFLSATKDPRPLTYTRWTSPRTANGPIPYFKGALVLHYLRFILGEESFWNGIREYTRSRFGTTATASDLRQAFERVSGKRLDRFFAQWVASADLPGIVASHRAGANEVVVKIEQRQETLFELPMMVAIETTTGRRTHRIVVDEKHTSVRFPFSGELLAVRIDDGAVLPVEVRHARTIEMLLYQIAHEPDISGRIDAIQEARHTVSYEKQHRDTLLNALAKASEEDPSPLVRRIAEGIRKLVLNE